MFADGSAVETAEAWRNRRRPELKRLFAHYVYGYQPVAVPTGVREIKREPSFGGLVRYVELEVTYGDAPPATLSLFVPPDVASPPVLLALNKCGNHSLSLEPAVTVGASWVDRPCGQAPDNRGIRDASWPVEAIVSRGYALATVHESDIDPDDPFDERQDGVHPYFAVEAPSADTRWGTLAAWAWGLSRMVDALEQVPDVDASRIATVGHSRRGKAALLAAALDERIAMTIPHQSGTGGATLSRSYGGESVFAITTFFPHWFDGLFAAFANEEPRLPIDQHLLVALVAPRPLMASEGLEDDWADPEGARLSVQAASPVYELLGPSGVIISNDGSFELDAQLTWQTRPGGHSLQASDWQRFMDFADLRL
jgi:hypothetical protein